MTTKPITIEKQQPGLWHVAHIDSEGRLITRTTVMPNDTNEPTELNGAVGDTDQIAWELGRAVRRLGEREPESGSVHRYRTMLRNTREWHDQFPNQERAVVDEQLPIVIYGDGVIRSPERLIPQTDECRMSRIGRISDFRTPGSRTPSTFHALRLTGRAGVQHESAVLERDPPHDLASPMNRIQHQDAWYELVLRWWQTAHERKLITLHDGAWSLPRGYKGPKQPFRVR